MDTDTVWFWVEDGERQGPSTLAELRRRFVSGELARDTLVWQAGMESWVPAGESVAFGDCWPATPEEEEEGEAADLEDDLEQAPAKAPEETPAGEDGGSQPQGGAGQVRVIQVPAGHRRPVVRFFARLVDSLSWSLLISLLLAAFGVTLLEASSDPFLGFALMMGYLMTEAACLARWGVTPGKWLLRVRVVTAEGRPPSFRQALHRAISVFIFGLALGIYPPLTLAAMVWAFISLRERGMTFWDRTLGLFVLHQPVKPVRGVVAVLWISGFMSAIYTRHPDVFGSFLDPAGGAGDTGRDAPLEEPAVEDHPDDVLRDFPRPGDGGSG